MLADVATAEAALEAAAGHGLDQGPPALHPPLALARVVFSSAQGSKRLFGIPIGSPSSARPPAAASGEMWPMAAPCEAPEKRPSAMRAGQGGSGSQHLL